MYELQEGSEWRKKCLILLATSTSLLVHPNYHLSTRKPTCRFSFVDRTNMDRDSIYNVRIPGPMHIVQARVGLE